MSIQTGVFTSAHGDSSLDKQIRMAAETIWGIEGDKLPQEKYDELKNILVKCLTKQCGPYEVQGLGDAFLIHIIPKVDKNRQCSLDDCKVTDAVLKCSQCKVARYCSKEHQRLDWSRHKVECIPMKK